jgi:signal transduction histidine kinase
VAPALAPSPTTVLSVLAGLCAAWTAAVAGRALRTDEERVQTDLAGPFCLASAVLAGCALAHPVVAGPLSANVISIVPLVAFLLVLVPWNTFAFRYAGRGRLVTRRRTAALVAVTAALVVVYALVAAGVLRPAQDYYASVLLGASTLLLGLVALTFVSAGLVLLAAYRHERVSLAGGLAVVVPVVVLVAAIQVVSLSSFLTRDLLAAIHLLAASAALPVAVARYDVLETRPGTTTLGERAVVEDLDEAVLVVGATGDVVRSNRQADRLFGDDTTGRRVDAVTGTDVDGLRAADTHEQWTAAGYRRFDPRVSTVRSDHGQPLGQTVTLIDVTDREMLEQRIQVLNRILRHNIRNGLDVINAHVEAAVDPEDRSDDPLADVLHVTDDIERMSAKARRIEKLTRDSSSGASEVDLAALVSTVVAEVTDDHPDVTTVVDVPSRTLSLDRELLAFGLRNVVENAIEHNEGPSRRVEVRGTELPVGVRVVVADDGPGVPETEWRVVEAGREEATDHATSLGLWGTKWAVQTLGGELSLRESDLGGTAVVVDLPTADRRVASAERPHAPRATRGETDGQ